MNNMASGSKELQLQFTAGNEKEALEKQGSHIHHSSEKHEVHALK